MGVSGNSGIPKSSIFIGLSIINHPFWGTTIFGNTHIVLLYFKKGHWFRYRRREEPRVSSCSVLGWPSLAHLRRTRSLATCRASESECHSSCCHPRNPRSLRQMREVDEALMPCLQNLKVSQDVRHSSMRTQDFLKYVHKPIENLFSLFVYLRLLAIIFSNHFSSGGLLQALLRGLSCESWFWKMIRLSWCTLGCNWLVAVKRYQNYGSPEN